MNFRSTLQNAALSALIGELQKHGPFADVEARRLGPNEWSLDLIPRSPDTVVGYASVAEFQLRICRYVEIENVSRVDSTLQAAASW